MTVEELKIEANKLGYNIIKKQPYVKLLPCTCGQKKPTHWYKFGNEVGEFYKCPKCDFMSPVAKTKNKAKENWNEAVTNNGGNRNAERS